MTRALRFGGRVQLAAVLVMSASPLTCASAPRAEAPVITAPNEAMYGVVHIGVGEGAETDAYLGTGFFVSEGCDILSAAHLFGRLSAPNRNRIMGRVQLPSGKRANARLRLLYLDAERDLALLDVASDDCTTSRHFTSYFRLWNSDAPPNATEPVLILGFPGLFDGEEGPGTTIDVPSFRRGTIANSSIRDPRMPLLLLDLQSVPGYSGSPVILERTYEVVGYIFGPWKQRFRTFGFSWALPVSSSEIEQLLTTAHAHSPGTNNSPDEHR